MLCITYHNKKVMEYIYKERQNEYEPSISGEKYTDNVG